jgi:hypothetical protein
MTVKNNSQLVIYQTEAGETKIDVRFQDETVWLNQKLLSDLFQVTVPTVNEHIRKIYEEGELEPDSTIRKFLIVQKEGGRQISRKVDFYNLDMIISVGYRIKSRIATHFRRWATRHLREFIVKGFGL